MLGVVLALSFWSGLMGHHDDIRRESVRLNRWTLDVRRDTFTGETTCTIKGANMVLENRVLTFSFGRRVDTANAIFRVDLGGVQAVGPLGPEAAGLGARLSSSDLGNPSGGLVHIPAHYLQGAGSVRIRPNPTSRDKIFSLNALAEAVATGVGKGCPPFS
jgi:hypothetical protein